MSQHSNIYKNIFSYRFLWRGCLIALLPLYTCGWPLMVFAEQNPIGTKALGMGGAYSAIAQDASGMNWSPNSMLFMPHIIEISSEMNFPENNVTNWSVNYAQQLSRQAAWGFGLVAAQFPQGSGWEDTLLNLAAAFRAEGVAMGIKTGINKEGTNTELAVRLFGKSFEFGLYNLGHEPMGLRIGLGIDKLPVQERGFSFGIQFEKLLEDEIPWVTRLGLNIYSFEWLCKRFGMYLKDEKINFTLGLGLEYSKFQFDYAMIRNPEGVLHHSFSITERFGANILEIEKREKERQAALAKEQELEKQRERERERARIRKELEDEIRSRLEKELNAKSTRAFEILEYTKTHGEIRSVIIGFNEYDKSLIKNGRRGEIVDPSGKLQGLVVVVEIGRYRAVCDVLRISDNNLKNSKVELSE